MLSISTSYLQLASQPIPITQTWPHTFFTLPWQSSHFMFPVISTILIFSHLKERVTPISLLQSSANNHIKTSTSSSASPWLWDCSRWLLRPSLHRMANQEMQSDSSCRQTDVSCVYNTLMACLSLAFESFGPYERKRVNVDSLSCRSLRCCWWCVLTLRATFYFDF